MADGLPGDSDDFGELQLREAGRFTDGSPLLRRGQIPAEEQASTNA